MGIKELADQRELQNQERATALEQLKMDNDQLRQIVKENANNLEKFRRVGDDLRLKNNDYERRVEEASRNHMRIREEKVHH